MLSWILAVFIMVVTLNSDLTGLEFIGCFIVAGLFAIAGNISLHR